MLQHVRTSQTPLLYGYWRSAVEYVASDGMEGIVLRWRSVEDTSALAGADRVAVHWGSTANPIVTTCTAGLKGQVWCTSWGL